MPETNNETKEQPTQGEFYSPGNGEKLNLALLQQILFELRTLNKQIIEINYYCSFLEQEKPKHIANDKPEA